MAHRQETDDNVSAVVPLCRLDGCVGAPATPRATRGCSCVNPGPSLTTQKTQGCSHSRVVAALSPRRPLHLVQHVWKCDGVINTQQSCCDPDAWGRRWANEGVNDLTTGCAFLLMETQRSNVIHCFCIRDAVWKWWSAVFLLPKKFNWGGNDQYR